MPTRYGSILRGSKGRTAEATSAFYGRLFFPFFVAVVAIQSVHMFEHVVQVAQVYLLGVPDNNALGLLGYVIQFNDTEEWLHLAFNGAFLLSLYALALPMRGLVPGVLPPAAFGVFLAGAVGLESWHVVEHLVIISNVIRNDGCPCPGIGDAALGVTDTQLHFVYNAVAYAALVVPFRHVMRRWAQAPAGEAAA